MLSTLTSSVYAAQPTNFSNTNVTIEIEAGGPSVGPDENGGPIDKDGNLISITVPSVLPFIFNKNGTTTTPTDWSIKNYDTDDVRVDNIYFEPHRDWNIHQTLESEKPGEYLLDKGHNYKTIEIYVGEQNKNNHVSTGLKTDENRIKDINMIIKGVEEAGEGNYNFTTLDFKINRTAFTEASNEYDAYTMHIDFAFDGEIISGPDINAGQTLSKEIFRNEAQSMKEIHFDGVNDNMSILENPDAVDLSEEQNESIMGLETSNGEYHIVSTDTFYAPEDSSGLFQDFINLKAVTFKDFDTSQASNMNDMFNGCSNLTDIDLTDFDTTNVQTMNRMFYYCDSLTSLTFGPNFGQDYNLPDPGSEDGLFYSEDIIIHEVNGANSAMQDYLFADDNRIEARDGTLNTNTFTTAISGMKHIYFDGNTGDLSILLNENANDLSEAQDKSIMGIDVGGGKYHIVCSGTMYAPSSLSRLFYNNSDIITVDFGKLDTSKTLKMDMLFCDCSKLESVNLDNINTSRVYDMMFMFSGCLNLSNIDLSNFNTSSVTDMNGMFYECPKLTTLDLRSFDTSKVKSFYQFVRKCDNLKTIIFGEKWNTSSATNMSYMFAQCLNLTSIDVSKFNTSSVTDMIYMFGGCTGLTTLDVSNFNTTSIFVQLDPSTSPTSGLDSFAKNCPNLKTIILGPNFGQSNNLPRDSKLFAMFGVDGTSKVSTTVVNANTAMKSYNWATNNRTVTFTTK